MKLLKSNPKSLFHLAALVGAFVAVSTLIATAQITPTNGIVYVKHDGSGNGSNWDNATADLQGAINAVGPTGTLKVFVAKGVYTVGEHSFIMRERVEIYGGFDPGNGIRELTDARIIPSGAGGASGSVLDGDNARPVIWNDYDFDTKMGASAILDGFTLRRGRNIQGGGFNGKGGGMYNNFATPTVRNCEFTNNEATNGGAIFISGTPAMEVTNCFFRNNKAYNGGAIYGYQVPKLTNTTFNSNRATNDGGAIYAEEYSSVSAYNCSFEQNRADMQGGAIYMQKAIVDFQNSTFNSNRARHGGAIYAVTSRSDVPLANCIFLGNATDEEHGWGGALYSQNSRFIFSNCEFVYNVANRGGGVYNSGMFESISGWISSEFTRCIFTENGAVASGGGMYNHGPSSPMIRYSVFSGNRSGLFPEFHVSIERDGGAMSNTGGTTPRIINSIFYNNTAPRYGGGMYNSSGKPFIFNTLFTGNTAPSGGAMYNTSDNSYATIRNCIIRGNSGGVHDESVNLSHIVHSMVQGVETGPNYNIDGDEYDPLFVNPADPIGPDGIWGTVDDGFRLQASSILRDHGSNEAYEDADGNNANNSLNNDVDLAGQRRFALGAVDVGPYEFTIVPNAGGIVYVRKGYNGSGTTWEDATGYLQAAIDAEGPHKVLVASGVYGVGTRSFIMKNNVEIYGGFDPDNGIRDLTHNRMMPNPANNSGSVLDGEESRPVIWNVFGTGNAMDRTAVLDGFTITNGSNGTGAGITNVNASPVLSNLVIRNNKALSMGGGVFNDYNSSPLIINTVISRNELYEVNMRGVGIANLHGSDPVIVNSNIVFNTYSFNTHQGNVLGVGMYSNGASPQVYNSIFWGNKPGTDFNAIGFEGQVSLTIKNSITTYPTSNPGDNNKGGVNPLFVDADGNNFNLLSNSPAINSGANSFYPSLNGSAKDLAGNLRLVGTTIDIGAYESPDGALPVRWVSFEGRLDDQRRAVLTWKTEETNVLHYEVERSVDAKEFHATGTVTAGGTGSGQYSHTDPAAVSGRIYYRIRQVDLDGTFSYSRIISLAAEGQNKLFAYPNPAKDRTMIELGPEYIGSKVRLLSPAGTVMQQAIVTERAISISLHGYAAGIYLLQTSDGKAVRLIKE